MAITTSEMRIEELIDRCDCILEDCRQGVPEDRIGELMEEMKGFGFQLMVTRSQHIIQNRAPENVRMVKGWLIANFAPLTAQSGSTTVNAVANSSSSADVSVSMTQSIREIDNSDLSKEDAEAIKAAIADLVAADKADPAPFCDKAMRVLDFAKKSAETLRAVSPLVAAVLSSI